MVYVDIKVWQPIYKYKFEMKYFNVHNHTLYIEIKRFMFLSAVLLTNFIFSFECPLTMNITTLNDTFMEQ